MFGYDMVLFVMFSKDNFVYASQWLEHVWLGHDRVRQGYIRSAQGWLLRLGDEGSMGSAVGMLWSKMVLKLLRNTILLPFL
jgi:hypothetical protein